MEAKNILFALLKAVVCGGVTSDAVKAACTPQMLDAVYHLAQKHDLAHLVGQGINKLGLSESEANKYNDAAMKAVYRYVRLSYDYSNLCAALDAAGISYIPLKGSVLRERYPEPWMRTSCDVDILVHPEDLDAAATCLVEKLHYTRRGLGDHDLSMFTPSGLHVELHYNAVDEGRFPKAQNLLKDIWRYAAPADKNKCRLVLTDEMFYFYHIAHMAKHFENGGCGIRPFLDLWILDHQVDHDPSKRWALLREGDLLTFGQAAQKLSEVWFSGAEADALSQKLESYILEGGVYGNMKNAVAVKQNQKGGKLKYVLTKVFPPYDQMKYYYPVLQKHKWLTPVYHIVRWWKHLFKQRGKSAFRILQLNAEMSKDEIQTTADLLKYLGL